MKRVIICSVVFFALVSCAKVTSVESPNLPITFDVVNYVNSTKADDLGHLEYTGTFGVFAYFNTALWADASATTSNLYMNNVAISQQTNGTWAPDSPVYWPKSAYLTFAAYSPHQTTGSNKVPVYDKATASYQFDDYEVSATNTDLMVADLAINKTANETTQESATNVSGYHFTTGVPILFHHLLTDLQFRFQRGSYQNDNVDEDESFINVTKVRLVNFIDTKDYASGEWAANDAAGSKAYDITNGTLKLEVPVGKEGTTLLPAAPNDVIIMPQTLVNPKPASGPAPSSFQALEVTYDIHTFFKDSETGETQTTAMVESNVKSTVPFYFAGKAATETDEEQAAITEFKKNQKIVYTVTIFPYANNPILFDPAVVAWDETTGTLDLVNAD